jgi:signal transduction histidine kinase
MEQKLNERIATLERQLSHQEKMAAIGLLSAGIMHEIQNPLNFIINFSKLSQELLADLEKLLAAEGERLSFPTREDLKDIMADLKADLGKIAENGNRVAETMQSVLRYSRGKEEFIPTDLAALVHEYTWLSFHAFRGNPKGFNVDIREDYEPELPQASLVPQSISRVVLNLASNALYALASKAASGKVVPYQPCLRVSLYSDGANLCLRFADNGTGIPADVLDKLFTPFFTTKPVGEGTGLGLSISKSIVEDVHHGRITVESEEGKFTRFVITLPIQQPSAPSKQ